MNGSSACFTDNINISLRLGVGGVHQISGLFVKMAASGKKRKSESRRYVHPDLISEIFIYLPCKSIVRFKSVCKLFDSIARDEQFIEEHRKLNMKPSHYLNWDETDKTKMHVFSLGGEGYSHVKTIETYKYKFALPSSYGLVCLHGFDSKCIALLDPVSAKLMPLPDLPSPFAFELKIETVAPKLIRWRTNNLGFGLDLKSQKYKVVQFVIHSMVVSECYVLTVNNINDSSWRRIDVSDEFEVFLPYQPIYADGVLYWEMVSLFDDIFIQVFVFDLSREKMKVIDSPTKLRYDAYSNGKHFTALEGKLACVEFTPPDINVDMSVTMTIWKLNGVEWKLCYKLQIHRSSIPSSEQSMLHPLCIDGDGNIICEGIGDLFSYSIDNKTWQIYPPLTKKAKRVALHPHSNLSTIHSQTLLTSIAL